MRISYLAGAVLGLVLALPAQAQVTRVGPPSAAVSTTVEAAGAVDTLYVRGITPPALNPDAPQGAPVQRGDTRTQTIGALKEIGKLLEAQGYGLGDVVVMRVYLVGDPANGGKMDFAGMKDGYAQFFDTPAQPNKPTRTTVQVVGLADEGQLVEIDVVAVRPHKAR